MRKKVLALIAICMIAVVIFTSVSVADIDWMDIDETSISNSEESKYFPNYVYEAGRVVTLYNPEAAKMALKFCRAVGRKKLLEECKEWEKIFSSEGYEQLFCIADSNLYRMVNGEPRPVEGGTMSWVFTDHCDAVIGIKKGVYNGMPKYSIAIVSRGSQDFGDWVSNVGVASKRTNAYEFHSGFYELTEQLHKMFDDIVFSVDEGYLTLQEMIDDMTNGISKYSLFIAGHSQAGAMSDILAGYFLPVVDQVNPENFVAYTFAAPGSVYKKSNTSSGNIYNIYNDDDLVPTVPFGSYRIGYEYKVVPTDAERKAWYGDFYNAKYDAGDYRNPILNGFSTHLLKTYDKVFTDVNEKIKNGELKDSFPNTTYYLQVNEKDLFADNSCFLGWIDLAELEEADQDSDEITPECLEALAYLNEHWTGDITENLAEMILSEAGFGAKAIKYAYANYGILEETAEDDVISRNIKQIREEDGYVCPFRLINSLIVNEGYSYEDAADLVDYDVDIDWDSEAVVCISVWPYGSSEESYMELLLEKGFSSATARYALANASIEFKESYYLSDIMGNHFWGETMNQAKGFGAITELFGNEVSEYRMYFDQGGGLYRIIVYLSNSNGNTYREFSDMMNGFFGTSDESVCYWGSERYEWTHPSSGMDDIAREFSIYIYNDEYEKYGRDTKTHLIYKPEYGKLLETY